MKPDEVYVVYSQVTDEIISVHSYKEYANASREDLVNDAINRLHKVCAYVDDDDISKIEMRFVVGTLEEAVSWMRAPINE